MIILLWFSIMGGCFQKLSGIDIAQVLVIIALQWQGAKIWKVNL